MIYIYTHIHLAVFGALCVMVMDSNDIEMAVRKIKQKYKLLRNRFLRDLIRIYTYITVNRTISTSEKTYARKPHQVKCF